MSGVKYVWLVGLVAMTGCLPIPHFVTKRPSLAVKIQDAQTGAALHDAEVTLIAYNPYLAGHPAAETLQRTDPIGVTQFSHQVEFRPFVAMHEMNYCFLVLVSAQGHFATFALVEESHTTPVIRLWPDPSGSTHAPTAEDALNSARARGVVHRTYECPPLAPVAPGRCPPIADILTPEASQELKFGIARVRAVLPPEVDARGISNPEEVLELSFADAPDRTITARAPFMTGFRTGDEAQACVQETPAPARIAFIAPIDPETRQTLAP